VCVFFFSGCDRITSSRKPSAVEALGGGIKMVLMLQMIESGPSCVLCINSLIIPPPSLVKNENSSVKYNLLSLFTHLLPLEAIAISCLKIP
jgi:hypothetical protein